MMKRTRFGVRPDYHTTDEINALAPEKGVIVFNTDLKVNQYWDGDELGFAEPSRRYKRIGKRALSRLHREYCLTFTLMELELILK